MADSASPRPRGKSGRSDAAPGFYEAALSEAERVRLPRARKVQGLDAEIALLRVRLERLAREHPENVEMLLKGINVLVRAVAVKYRLSPKAEKDLASSLAGALRSVGAALGLEGMDAPER
ncbi:MAG: hypothetical protein Q7T26_04485 [Dehalococcoidia bacterium]|nr:hypothetical protein [Dehalococcoidia bacterium]